MLLIVFLGLIATLTSISDNCDVGNPKINDFDWNKFSGPQPWYFLLHNVNDFENNIDCVAVTYASPEENRSLITADVYDISEQRHIMFYGNATNWNSTGYFEVHHSVLMWSGQYYVLAIDYDRYLIAKHYPIESNKFSLYVAFRSKDPDEVTQRDVLKDLQDNNIDLSQLVEWTTDHCQETESSTEEGSWE